ncbi:hypothetical protein NQ317_001852 [Molorchus minor]|uniref:Uncharacterized protein n=1 Tax=Molorchus minor TaxID=1323400 RepID=A0ABQ9JZR7_9CUCU|nr:hypothetical protein NQ317_001852 [Molorchus minor]
MFMHYKVCLMNSTFPLYPVYHQLCMQFQNRKFKCISKLGWTSVSEIRALVIRFRTLVVRDVSLQLFLLPDILLFSERGWHLRPYMIEGWHTLWAHSRTFKFHATDCRILLSLSIKHNFSYWPLDDQNIENRKDCASLLDHIDMIQDPTFFAATGWFIGQFRITWPKKKKRRKWLIF